MVRSLRDKTATEGDRAEIYSPGFFQMRASESEKTKDNDTCSDAAKLKESQTNLLPRTLENLLRNPIGATPFSGYASICHVT